MSSEVSCESVYKHKVGIWRKFQVKILRFSISGYAVVDPGVHILREKSLAIYFEDLQFRRNRTFIFILSNIYVDKRSRIR